MPVLIRGEYAHLNDAPRPARPTSVYHPILLIPSLSVKLHFHLRFSKICHAFNGLP